MRSKLMDCKPPPKKLPTLDVDGYPTERSLTIIRKWQIIGDSNTNVHALLDYVQELWSYPERFYWYKKPYIEHYANGNIKYRKLYLSTGGWSGNESIIGSLQRNVMFWIMYWYKSERGGHYWFIIPEKVRSIKQ